MRFLIQYKYSQSREQRQITFDYAETQAFICAKHKYSKNPVITNRLNIRVLYKI